MPHNYTNKSEEEMRNKTLKVMSEQWNDLRTKLLNNVINSTNLIDHPFFVHFKDAVDNTRSSCSLELTPDLILYRAVPEENPTYDRFVPKTMYAKNHNRMNPPGKAFLYLSYSSDNRLYTQREAIETCLKEIRVKPSNTATICKFIPHNNGIGKKLLDISGDSHPDYRFNNFNKKVKLDLKMAKKNVSYTNETEQSIRHEIINRIFAIHYYNMLSDKKIFKPIDDDLEDIEHVREVEYAPFQAIASYLESIGLAGMIYRSTVNPSGKNIVIFDPCDATYIDGSMEQVNSSDYY